MGIRAFFGTLRSLAFGGISGTYAVLGPSLVSPGNAIRVINNTNGDLILSTDGVSDMLFIPAMSFVLYDISSNKNATGNSLWIPAKTQFYVKQSSAPTSGSVYIEVIHET